MIENSTQEDARKEIMGKLQHASSKLSVQQIASQLHSLGSAPVPALPCSNLCESFLFNIVKNQGTVNCASNRSEAVKAVADYLYERYHTRKLVAGNDPRLAAMPWRDAGLLPRFGAAEQGEIASLSYAKWGIAETGTIVTMTGRANPTANNLLVEDHIVLVDVSDLLITMDDAWDKINTQMQELSRPRGVNFISGPSSTADIEAQMVMGAHGPRAWHVILVGDVPESALDNARNGIAQNPE